MEVLMTYLHKDRMAEIQVESWVLAISMRSTNEAMLAPIPLVSNVSQHDTHVH